MDYGRRVKYAIGRRLNKAETSIIYLVCSFDTKRPSETALDSLILVITNMIWQSISFPFFSFARMQMLKEIVASLLRA